jgi:hypothetical protein
MNPPTPSNPQGSISEQPDDSVVARLMESSLVAVQFPKANPTEEGLHIQHTQLQKKTGRPLIPLKIPQRGDRLLTRRTRSTSLDTARSTMIEHSDPRTDLRLGILSF